MSTLLADATRKPLLPITSIRPQYERLALRARRNKVREYLSPVISIDSPEGTKEVVLKIASGRRELFEAFGLVYDAYRRAGLTPPNPCRMRLTRYHLLPTTEVFVAESRGRVICTMSLIGDGELGLPMEQVYANEVLLRRLRGGRLGEGSCLADCPDETSSRVAVELMRLLGQCAKRRGMDELLIAVHPRHAKFYERCAACRVIGGERTYASVCGKPAVALALDLHRSAVTHPALYQKFFGVSFPDEVLRRRPLPDELLDELREMAQVADVTIANVVERMLVSA